MIKNGSEILAEVLIEQGVDTVFGYPGGSVLHIYDALYKYSDRIRHIMTAHEQGAAHAADGYARATGRTGVVLATSGPGATNLVTGIATAYMDSVPMVAITGNVGTSLIGRDSFQEVYIAGITMPITKHNFVVRRVEDLADTLRSAFQIAGSGRKGPVLVDLPKDVTAAQCEFTPAPPPRATEEGVPAAQERLQEAAAFINAARRPVVLFGGGVASSGAGEELRALLQKADIPAAYTLMAAGVLGYGEPHNLGLLGMHGLVSANRAVEEADLLLAIGTRFSDRVALNTGRFASRAKIIHIDIDPSEINKNVGIDFDMIGDIKAVLAALLPFVEKAEHPDWMQTITRWQANDYHPKDKTDALTPHQILQDICDIAGEDAVFATDVGQHQMWAAQYIRHLHPRSFITSGGLGTMGFGYGASIGASIGLNGSRIIHITGDGSFHMNMNEACTAVTYGVPVITVIFNNRALGMVRQWQTAFYGKRYSSSEPDRRTDYVKVGEGFGVKAYRASTPAEFQSAFREAMTLGRPVWIECVIDREEKVLPMIPAGGTINDTIVD